MSAYHPASGSDGIRNGTLTLTGYGLDLRVDRGHLQVTHGVADERLTFRIPKVSPDLKRVVVVGQSGTVTLDALKWMQDTGVAFVQIDHDAELITTTAPGERRHAELIRAQALAALDGAALDISRQLIASKIEGQRSVLQRLPNSDSVRETLVRLQEDCAEAPDGSALLTIEAKAANEYWSAWKPVELEFKKPARRGVPQHWRTFGSRRSPYSNNGRNAVTPANAMLNYLYAVLRAEVRLATAAMGMEPGLGLYHATKRWKDSFSYDLMEPLRPQVDDFLLDLLEGRTFEKSEFFETHRGVVRIMPPLSSELSATASRWEEAVGPLLERIADELMAWADGGGRGALTRRVGNTSDGSLVPTRLTKSNYRAGGKSAKRKQEQSAREAWEANQEWEDDGSVAEVDYEEEILPGLEGVVIRRIAEETGLSMSYAAAIRSGREVPHRRHWAALLELAREDDPYAELRDRYREVDFKAEIQPWLEELEIEEIAEATGLTYAYAGEIRRGRTTPHLRHWPVLEELAEEGRKRAERWDDVDFQEDIVPGLQGLDYLEIAEAVGLSRSYVGQIVRGNAVPNREHWEAFRLVSNAS